MLKEKNKKNNLFLIDENILVLFINNKIIIKLLIFIIFIIITISNKLNKNKNKNIDVCVCTVGKLENRYIKEFLEHYKGYGVDKIFLYDNNDIDGEKFEDVIYNYIKEEFVTLIKNFRGKRQAALEIMNDCYKKNFRNYDWLIFFEIDEFIYLKNISNIKDFLKQSKFNKCQRIQLNWIFHTDNDLLFYDNRSLIERFPEREKKARGVKKGDWNGIKSILKGHIKNIKIKCIHTLNHHLKSCDGFGKYKKIDGIITRDADFEYYYIDHYYSKSTEEFINKINRGDVLHKDNRIDRIKTYFAYNKITHQKLDLIEKKIGLNLSEIRKKLYQK